MLFLGALPPMAFGQELNFDKVVITAPAEPELPAAVLAPKRTAAGDTATLLTDVPGVSLYTGGGVSSLPAIHGLNDDRLKILVDGMDIVSACSNHMNPPMSYIDPTHVGRVNVIAGITPVSQGGDSIGGTIAIASVAPKFASAGESLLVGGTLSAYYRNNGHATNGSVNVFAASENTSLSYAGSFAKAGNYQAADQFGKAPSSTVKSTRYESRNDSVTMAVQGGDNLFTLTFGEQEIPYQGFVNQYMDMTQNKARFVNAGYQGQFGWGRLEASAYDETTRHSMNFLADKSGNMPMETEGKNAGFRLMAELPLNRKDSLRIGAEYRRFRENDWWPPVAGSTMMGPDTFWNLNNGQRDRKGIFGEWEKRWNAAWTSLIGLRYEHVAMNAGQAVPYATSGMMNKPDWNTAARLFNAADRRHGDNNLDFTALVRYTPNATSSFEGGYARKTRSPNLYELYAWGQTSMDMKMNGWFGDGNGYVGNLGLKRESADTLSATASWHNADRKVWEFKATPYYTRVHDYIDVDRCPVNPDGGGCKAANLTGGNKFVYLQFANHDARIYGLDLSGHMLLGETGLGRFTGKAVVGYVNGKNQDSGDRLYHMMPLNGKFSIEQRLGQWTNALELQLVSAKDDVSQVRNEAATPGYSLVNLRTSYDMKQVRIEAGLDNLFNKQYYLPLGGTYLGDKTIQTWGYGVPGMGRSAYVGLTVKF